MSDDLCTAELMGMPTERLVEALNGLHEEMRAHPASWRAHTLWDRIYGVQDRLAIEFGVRRGWKLSQKSFSLRTLARRGVFSGRLEHDHYRPELMDHPYYYRTDRHAAGLVGHLYNVEMDAIEEARLEYGVRVEFPTDFPSWHYPPYTTLVVWTPPERVATVGWEKEARLIKGFDPEDPFYRAFS